MAKRIRSVYHWQGSEGTSTLERVGTISEARLRAWEYHADIEHQWEYVAGPFHDTVRTWTTARPDLRVPETLLIGEQEERVAD